MNTAEYFINVLRRTAIESWLLLGEMAPYLILGFAVAGVLSVLLPTAFVRNHMGKRGLGSVLKAALFGVPLPLCSCAVIPVAASLRTSGASRSATTSFLISTPQSGVDSIAITYALLGPVLAVVRPVVALCSGAVGGLLVTWFGGQDDSSLSKDDGETQSVADACHSTGESCCHSEGEPGSTNREHNTRWVAWRENIAQILRYGLITLPRDISTPLLVGVVISGALTAIFPTNQFQDFLGPGILSILAMIALSVPLYVCATGSVPIALGLIQLGVSPGAAVAFLVAGPATNSVTLTTVWRFLGPRTTTIFLLTVVMTSIGCGLVVDYIIPQVRDTIPLTSEHHEHLMEAGIAIHLWAIALLLLLFGSLRRVQNVLKRLLPAWETEQDDSSGEAEQEEHAIHLAITGMTCQHCVGAVEEALQRVDGVSSVQVFLQDERAVVQGAGVSRHALETAVASAGFQAEAEQANQGTAP